jgi:RNA polymerase sigma-70 factor (ECF subfamily)
MSVRSDNVIAELQNVAAGEPLSVRDLIRRHHASLMHVLRRRMRVPEDANDVAQEAYIRMMQYDGSCEVRFPTSLLFRIAINVAKDQRRADDVRHVGQQCDIDDLQLDSGRADPEREVSAAQDLDSLYEVIEALSPKCRRAFLLSRVQGLTYAQIAEECGISVKMVEKHISNALARCAAKIAV